MDELSLKAAKEFITTINNSDSQDLSEIKKVVEIFDGDYYYYY